MTTNYPHTENNQVNSANWCGSKFAIRTRLNVCREKQCTRVVVAEFRNPVSASIDVATEEKQNLIATKGSHL